MIKNEKEIKIEMGNEVDIKRTEMQDGMNSSKKRREMKKESVVERMKSK